MTTRVKVAIGVGSALVLALVAYASIKSRDKNVVRVTTAKVSKAPLVATVSCNGRVQAKTKVDISSQVMGQIVALAVEEGEVVKKGDLLLQIDKVQYDANAQATQAGLDALFAQRDADKFTREQAERDLERTKKNFQAHIESEQNLQKAQLALDSAKANVHADERRIEQARANLLANKDSLKKTTITSPIDGVVTAKPVEQGENAIVGTMNNPGTVLLTVSDMSVVEGEMEIDETDIPHVKVGQTAKLTFDAYPDKKFDGVVTEIGGSPITKSALGTDSSAVNFKVKVEVKNPPSNIRPGFSVSGKIETDRRASALAIPIPALVVADPASLERPKGKKPAPVPTPTPAAAEKKKDVEGVFVVKKGGVVDFRPVKTGINADLQTEVLEGLADGEEIVTGPFKALRTLKIGDRVKVDNSAAPEAAKKS
ncbi:MAG TPA: efflux RND transporter periplasmic adaptor subunit [Thermoanaerobaculia bacterium]|nr:efflux RND transporter periplasmic adaptor subunit [Thermoanaerobaculia bacterium]